MPLFEQYQGITGPLPLRLNGIYAGTGSSKPVKRMKQGHADAVASASG